MGRPETRPLVIVDANAWIGDWRARGQGLSALLAAANRGELDVAVPEVVLREVMRAFGRSMEEVVTKNREVARELERLGIDWPHAPDRAEVAAYETWLRELLAAHAVRVLPLPSDNHEDLVGRDLGGRKPFSHDGSGYRDALIWSNVLDAAQQRPVLFVTHNAEDFAEGKDRKDQLHQDLQADLTDRQLDVDRVRLFPRPSDLLTHIAGRELDVTESLNAAFQAETGLRNGLVVMLDDALLTAGTDAVEVDGPDYVDEILLEVVHEPITIIAETASQIGPDTYLVDLYVEADVDVYVSAMFEDDDPWRRPTRRRASVGTTATLGFTAECTYDRRAIKFSGVSVYGSAQGRVDVS